MWVVLSKMAVNRHRSVRVVNSLISLSYLMAPRKGTQNAESFVSVRILILHDVCQESIFSKSTEPPLSRVNQSISFLPTAKCEEGKLRAIDVN